MFMYNQSMLSASKLQSNLPILGLGEPLYFYQSIGSTNNQASDLAKQGAPHGTLVVAEEQTAGRGRAGRMWYSPANAALALSLVLRPKDVKPESAGGLTALGALAVVDALENVGIEAEIKWPNDVLVHDRKIAGILTEISWEDLEPEFVILGIGVNVRSWSIPPDEKVDFPATCVEAVVEKRVDRQKLLLGVIEGVGRWLPKLGGNEITSAWNHRLAYRGQEVVVLRERESICGRVQGLTTGGHLILVMEDRKNINVTVGDVHLRKVDMNSK
jgi:BirA family biotin operon repressor/biotin-[acetyl-CoA-carboxylase] ligase